MVKYDGERSSLDPIDPPLLLTSQRRRHTGRMFGANLKYRALQRLSAAEDRCLHARDQSQPIRIAQNPMRKCSRVAFRMSPKRVNSRMCI